MFLDTSFLIDLMRERSNKTSGPASRKLRDISGYALYMPLFVACELHAGARLARDPEKELAKVERLCDLVEVVMPGRGFAVAYGENEASLRKKGCPIPVMDLLIGTLARLHGMPLLTRDAEHYRKIPGLIIEPYLPDSRPSSV